MSKNRLFAVLSGMTVTININGSVYTLSHETEEEADALMSKTLDIKKRDDDEEIKRFQETLDPGYKISSIEGIQRSNSGQYYLEGYNIPIPAGVAKKMKEFADKGLPYEPLINFTKLLLLNPDKHVREDLFRFADTFSFPITDNGYFIAYKSVAWKGESKKQYGIYIAEKYVSIKAAGLNPREYNVITMGEEENHYSCIHNDELVKWIESRIEGYDFSEHIEFNPELWLIEHHFEDWRAAQVGLYQKEDPEEAIRKFAEDRGYIEPDEVEFWKKEESYTKKGNLEEVFQKINNLYEFDAPTFTDWHSQKSTIKLGQAQKLDREKCDNDPSKACSTGLHIGTPEYTKTFGSGPDKYIIACLINPMNVVAVPHDYSFQKMRTCEYFPYALAEFKDNTLHEIETAYFENDYGHAEKEHFEEMMVELAKKEGVGSINQEEVADHEKLIRERLVVINSGM